MAVKKGILLHLKKASITVEAAFALPIFIAVIICAASIMGIYSQTLEKMVSLRDSAETAALAASASDEEVWIELPGVVSFTPLMAPSGVTVANVWCTGSARAWTGRDPYENGVGEGSRTEYVYVTETGTVYHTSSACTHISLSISVVSSGSLSSLRNEGGAKYKACEKCADGGANASVYITKHGDRYHNSSSCSGLKRTVKMVDISTVSGLRECSKCASMS